MAFLFRACSLCSLVALATSVALPLSPFPVLLGAMANLVAGGLQSLAKFHNADATNARIEAAWSEVDGLKTKSLPKPKVVVFPDFRKLDEMTS